MMYSETISLFNGSLERRPTDNFAVSFWYIPHGSDYAQAQPVEAFFEEEEQAYTVVRIIGQNPPEMAFVYPLNVFYKGDNQWS